MNPAPSTERWNELDADTQLSDLHDGYWAEVGPVSYGWSWTIRDSQDTTPDSGWAADEAGAKAAVADWAEDDLLVAEITAELLSEAFTAYGHTKAAVAHAVLAVAATTQIAG